jgi:lactate permease
MSVGQTLLSATEGASFGFFPILWIVLNAIWVYNLTVASGHFDVLRWLGVAVTGSDTSSNALFCALQVQTAKDAGLNTLLFSSANSSGGVLGKMISPQNLAIAASAVGMSGHEGLIFRKVIGWSLLLLVLMCLIVGLQGTPVLGWMIPGN